VFVEHETVLVRGFMQVNAQADNCARVPDTGRYPIKYYIIGERKLFPLFISNRKQWATWLRVESELLHIPLLLTGLPPTGPHAHFSKSPKSFK
jgi:hypothetical protein